MAGFVHCFLTDLARSKPIEKTAKGNDLNMNAAHFHKKEERKQSCQDADVEHQQGQQGKRKR